MTRHDSIDEQTQAHGLGPLVRALTSAPEPHELLGVEDAVRAFRRELHGIVPGRRQIWRAPMRPTVFRVSVSSALTGAAAGVAAAGITFASMTVPQFQNVASDTELPIVAVTTATPTPADDESAGETSTGTETESTQTEGTQTEGTETEGTDTDGTQTVGTQPQGAGKGPDAAGPAAFGLCTAWAAHERNGAEPTGSIAFQNLAAASGGTAGIAAYCASVNHPTATASAEEDSAEDSDTESDTQGAQPSGTVTGSVNESSTGKHDPRKGKHHKSPASHGKGHVKHGRH